MIDLLHAQRPPEQIDPPRPSQKSADHRVAIVAWVTVALLFVAAMAFLITDQLHERNHFDHARASLGVTRQRTASVSTDLAELRRDVVVLLAQVGSDSTAYGQDTAQLKTAESALASTQADVSQQTTQISALNLCLGGVEQTLNALAVGSKANAIAALNSVAASCTTASNG